MKFDGNVLKIVLLSSVAAGSMLICGAAFAQSVPTGPQSATELDDVVVTANKREERLSDVAMSVSAITGEDLDRTQALKLQDIASKVPGLNLQQSGSGLTRIMLRGQNAGGAGATVATVLDDVPISFSGATSNGAILASDFDTYDLERIEVLRGPQGTLYGATAEGGLVKYVTRAPDLNRFDAGIEAGASTIAHGETAASGKGFVNIPLLDGTAAFRASGFYEELPGWIDNRFLGQTEVNGGKRYGGRASLLWTPNDALSVRGTAVLQDREQDGGDTVAVFGSSRPTDPLGLANGYNLDSYRNTDTRNKLAVYALNVDYDLGWGQLQSITSYGTVKTHYDADTPSLAPFISLYQGLLGQPVTPSNQVTLKFDNNLEKFNQEFRLSSSPDSQLFSRAFEWQLGLFYTKEDVIFDQYLVASTFPAGVLIPGLIGNVASYNVPSSYEDTAVYADATYHFTPKFDVEVGVRVSRNEQSSQTTSSGLLVSGTNTPSVLPEISTSETVTTYSFAPRYHLTPDVMIYGRIASGYRPGGPTTPIVGAATPLPNFESDSTVNYETGLKGSFLDRTVSIDIAAFYIDWTDIQILQRVNYVLNGQNLATNITGNGGTAVSQGVELSAGWKPVAGLEIGFVGAYTDAYLDADAPGVGGVKGQRLAYVPKLSTALSANYEWSLGGDATAFVGGSWAHVGDRKTDLNGQIELPSYENYSAQIGVSAGRYSFQVYGKNLGDARAVTNYAPTGALGGYGTANLIDPRTVGFRLTAGF